MTSPYVTFAPPGHYYSPLPDYDEVMRNFSELARPEPKEIPGIDFNVPGQLDLLSKLALFAEDFKFPDEYHVGSKYRYFKRNGYFQDGDGFILYAMMRHLRPKRIIEVGSGFSSALMMDTCDLHDLKIILAFIEPDPVRLKQLMRPADAKRCIVVPSPVQHVNKDAFKSLQPGDILFIDSSHVSKIGSDVNFLFFEILPMLPAGVWVHIHDIFPSFEYPLEFHKEGRAWNEDYLLRAFLMHNSAYKVRMFAGQLVSLHPDALNKASPKNAGDGGASIWLEKIAM